MSRRGFLATLPDMPFWNQNFAARNQDLLGLQIDYILRRLGAAEGDEADFWNGSHIKCPLKALTAEDAEEIKKS